MTLCQNSKTKYFGRLFLAFVMLLGGVFITNTSARAEYDYVVPEINEVGNLITIPEYTGEAVLICFNNGWDQNGSDFVLNNATSTRLLEYSNQISYGNDVYGNISYLENPTIGENLSWQQPSSQHRGIGKCLLVKNYDSNIGISTTLLNEGGSYMTNWDVVIPPNENENFLMLVFSGNFWGNEISISNASSTEILRKFNNNGLFQLWKTESNLATTSYPFAINTSSSAGNGFFKLNIGQVSGTPTPPSNDYVMYYGNNPVYTPINTNYNLPVVYNVCDSWEEGKIILKLNNDNASSYEKLLTQCSGTFNFNSGAGSSEMSNTSYFTIENFRDDTILATSANFLSTVYTPLNASDGFIVWNFPAYQYFDYTKTATTSLAFQYNVCSDENYSTSSKICIRNTSHPTNDPSSYCVNLETCSGTGNIELPVFAQENTLTMNFSYYDKNNNYQLGSNEFFIVYYNGTYDTRAKWLVQAGEIACSPEEWASDNIFMNIKCGAFTSGVVIAQTLGNSASTGVRILIRTLDGVFPFNLPIKIKQCWDNSETELLPSELDKINILDESGNVKINMPSEWAESGSITIWGSDVWNSTNESNQFFAFIRNLSKYLIWGVFILIFYLWGKSLIDK